MPYCQSSPAVRHADRDFEPMREPLGLQTL
jgi:hypothetical protein